LALTYNRKPKSERRKELEKLANISEILGLLIETHRDKDWIFGEMKKKRLHLSVKKTVGVNEILKSCPVDFISYLLNSLKGDDFDSFASIPVLTRTYHWFYTDLVGSSDPEITTKDQARKVWVLTELIGRTDTFKQRDARADVMQITGDGMVIGFSDSPEKPLHLAMELHKALSKYNQSRKEKEKIHIRIGMDTGPVYFVKDLTGKDNFWGPGIITARRIMDLARPMQILASSRIANDIRKLSPENKSVIHNAGTSKIKHNEKLSLFNIYGDGWGNKREPLNKIEEKITDIGQNQTKFLFPRVEVHLDVSDPKKMKTHHTWLWHIVNIREIPIEQVSYFIGGDVPKDFADTNVSIKDEDNNKLKIVSVNINKPLTKEFLVKLEKPIKQNQKRRFLKLEYDWEEPERKFIYTLASECKKFKYVFTIPKGAEIKNRILKVDPATRAKVHASPPANIRYLDDKTEITWQASNLHSYDTYQFEW